MTEFFQSTHFNCNPPIPSISPLLSKNLSSPEHRDIIFGKVEGMEGGVVMLLSPRDLALLKNNKKPTKIRS